MGDILVSKDGEFMNYNDGIDDFIIEAPLLQPSQNKILVGVLLGSSRPLKADIDLSELTQIELTGSNPIQVQFPELTGYPTFALELNIPLLITWYQSLINYGDIGGEWNELIPNLWPKPEVILFEGRYYRVYWTSYETQLFNENGSFTINLSSEPL